MAEVTNIDKNGVSLRLERSVYGVAVTLLAMVLLSTFHAPSWAFALLFVPFYMTSSLTFQGLYRT